MPSRSLKEVALSVAEVAFCTCSHAFTLHTNGAVALLFLEQCLVIIVASRMYYTLHCTGLLGRAIQCRRARVKKTNCSIFGKQAVKVRARTLVFGPILALILARAEE